MKTSFYLLLLMGFASFSQNQNTPLFVNSLESKTFKINDVKPFQPDLINTQFKNDSNTKKLSIYNPTSQWNDIYLPIGTGYFMSNSKSSKNLNWLGYKTDSFNPTGTDNLPFYIGAGALNLLLKKY